LIARLKSGWRELRRGSPGRRFQERYARQQQAGRCGALAKWCIIGGGLLVVLAGVVLLPLPGPGMVIVAFGALMIAGQSRATARALDRLELRARHVYSSWRSNRRRPLSRPGNR